MVQKSAHFRELGSFSVCRPRLAVSWYSLTFLVFSCSYRVAIRLMIAVSEDGVFLVHPMLTGGSAWEGLPGRILTRCNSAHADQV